MQKKPFKVLQWALFLVAISIVCAGCFWGVDGRGDRGDRGGWHGDDHRGGDWDHGGGGGDHGGYGH
jgi:hypothetical protein